LFAGSSQAVNATSKVDRIDGHEDAHLRGDLNHGALIKALQSPANVASPSPWSSMFMVAPRAFCS
jgi:hypothetical protein